LAGWRWREPARRHAPPLRLRQLKMPGNGTGRRDGMLQEDAALVRKRIRPRVSFVEEFD
jgi:hypothetical protein